MRLLVFLFVVCIYSVNVFSQNSWSLVHVFRNDTVYITAPPVTGYKTNKISKVIFTDDNKGFAQTSIKEYPFGTLIPESTSYQLITNDGGVSWDTLLASGMAYGSQQSIRKCGRDTLLFGYIDQTHELNYCRYSIDHGTTWVDLLRVGFFSTISSSFHLKNTQIGYYFSGPNFVRKTGNNSVITSLTQTPYSLSGSQVYTLAPEKVICIVDNMKRIVLSQDSGYTWSSSFNSTLKLTDVAFSNDFFGYISCDSGKVLKTIDGGLNWTDLNTASNVKLNTIEVYNDTILWAGGNNGIFLTSFNGGATWNSETLPDNGDVNSVQYTTNYIYVCTNKGNLYRSSLVLSSPEISSSEISIKTIYPNPTNGCFKLQSKSRLISYEVIGIDGKVEETGLYSKEGNTYTGNVISTHGIKIIVSIDSDGKIYRNKLIVK